MRPRRPHLLLGLGEGALGRHAPARTRPAHRADGDRRRDRVRDRLSAGAARTPLRQARAPDRGAVGAALHDPEPRALPAAHPVQRAHVDDRRDRARRLHTRDPVPELRRGTEQRAGRGARGRTRHGPHPDADATAGRAAAGRADDHRRPACRRRLDDRDRDDRGIPAARRARLPDRPRTEGADTVQDGDLLRRCPGGRIRARLRPAARCAAPGARTWAAKGVA